ncbi:type II secretion system protein GspM [Thiohalorhabdus sp. Cl-TMA]|uniref:Type II secretion system protein GspM n=1 Tax=Thiohalorhabdus methylotrophus TaxID=3242694 RepID=A0ABV4TZR7_9GAMM
MWSTWWRERAPRERALLIGGGAALVLVVFYLILEPRLQERQRLAAEIPQLREDLAWMQRHLSQAKQLGNRAGPGGGEGEERSLTPALVEESLRGSGLNERVTALRPSGGRGIQVAFDQVPFPELATWLRQLRNRSGAEVRKARFERLAGKEGVVKVDLVLAAGQGS